MSELGPQFKGQPVGFEAVSEPWSEYLLSDGKILRIKLVLTKVVKNPDMIMPDGNPNYGVKTGNIVEVFRSDELPERKKPDSTVR